LTEAREMRIAKDDTVKVIAGDDKGKTGRVLKVYVDKGRVLVEGVNFVKRHTKQRTRVQPGGIVQKEAPVQISNVVVVCPRCGEETRPKRSRLAEGRPVRICSECNEIIGKT
jgi:large subunit ribosomal protein L24